MENNNSQENTPPNPDKPRERVKIRRADAEPTYERIADKDTEQTITHIRPVKPSGGGANLAGLIVPVGVTLAIVAAGYFGFVHVKEQNARASKAEVAATDAESASEERRRTLADLTTAIRDTRSRIPLEAEKATREAASKADAEFREELATLSRNIAEANSAGRATAQKVAADLKGKITELKPKVSDLLNKQKESEVRNLDMKVWLNAHTLTMHPKF